MTNFPNLENLNDSELREIIIGKEEGRFLDFKSNINLDTPEEKREFLADVSSFANSMGGDLLIGVKEENGVATDVLGIELENPDKFKQKIENLIRDCIKPNLPSFQFKVIHLYSGNYLVLISLNESFNKPHAVTVSKNLRVYTRNSIGKQPLDIFEIKDLVLESSSIKDKVAQFHQNRIFAIKNSNLPFMFENEASAKFVIHVIPHNSFFKTLEVDFNEIKKWTELLSPLSSDYSEQSLNFDGILSCTYGRDYSFVRKYFQLFRNGIVESANVDMSETNQSGKKGISGNLIRSGVSGIVNQSIELYKNIEITSPIYVFITLLDLNDHYMFVDPRKIRWPQLKRFDRSDLVCPEVVIEDFEIDLEKKFNWVFDMIWNSAGFDKAYE